MRSIHWVSDLIKTIKHSQLKSISDYDSLSLPASSIEVPLKSMFEIRVFGLDPMAHISWNKRDESFAITEVNEISVKQLFLFNTAINAFDVSELIFNS